MLRIWHWCKYKSRDPRFLLVLVSALMAFAVQSGELGTADTQHRLQSAHALWTAEPPVFPNEYPEFGVRGRDGKLQSWYGIGQSLLMLPADIVGTGIERLPAFSDYNGNDPSVRDIVVSYSTNILISVLTTLVAFRFLGQLKFSVKESVVGVLALLAATTHLHYTQNMMENNYIFLLTLAGFSFELDWSRTRKRRALVVAAGALGLNLLTRLTTGLDLLAEMLFVLLVLQFEGVSGRQLWDRCRTYLATATPIFAVFAVLDRLYQYYRFGSFFNTYLGLVAIEAKLRDATLSPKYPFETPFHVGFFGALFSPEKSIFLFDPLLVLLIIVAVIAWKRFSPEIKAYVITSAVLLLAYISFYARYTVWSGDFAWGDRYVSTAVQLAAMLAVPLLMQHRQSLGRKVWYAGLVILGVSTLIQLASLAFWLPLEIYQMETLARPAFVIGFRLRNIVAFASGNMTAWGLDTPAMHEDSWDYVHITCWNFLPFLLKRAGVVPLWVVRTILAVWFLSISLLVGVLLRLRTLLNESANRPCEEETFG
jgi:hypothetical protein